MQISCAKITKTVIIIITLDNSNNLNGIALPEGGLYLGTIKNKL